jgi:ribulose bisphosphate carboxylase small subunit
MFRISHLVSKSIRSNHTVSIVTSRKNPRNKNVKRTPYLNFTNQINNTFEELTNEIVSDVESCVYDYPDEYVSLLTTSPEGHETIHLIYGPENENTRTFGSSSLTAPKIHQ